MPVKELTNLKVTELWEEFNRDFTDHWEKQDEALKKLKKRLIEDALEAERQDLAISSPYERTEGRTDYRNGFYVRYILTKMGLLDIRMPRLRHIKISSQVITKYQRREIQIDEALKRIFLYGVATRLVGEAVRPLLGEGVSAQTISNIAKGLDKEVRQYHRRPIHDGYLYLFLDGIVLKMKTGLGVKKKVVLVAYGITLEGRREIIDFMVTNSESEVKWEGFLNHLYERGLKADMLSLIVTDGNKGLHSAIDRIYPQIKRQRCWAHKLRNVSNRLKKAHRDECIKEARPMYDAENRKKAVLLYKAWAKKWMTVAPEAVKCVKDDLEELFNVYYCPKAIRIKLRTTNVIERAFREVRRRTRPMSCFNNIESIERIVYAIISYQNNKWRRKPLNEFTQNS
jgi:transposase-like protein